MCVKQLIDIFLQCILAYNAQHYTQGSGIGPTLRIVMASDLRCLSAINLLFN